jgi:hypothetical protein
MYFLVKIFILFMAAWLILLAITSWNEPVVIIPPVYFLGTGVVLILCLFFIQEQKL